MALFLDVSRFVLNHFLVRHTGTCCTANCRVRKSTKNAPRGGETGLRGTLIPRRQQCSAAIFSHARGDAWPGANTMPLGYGPGSGGATAGPAAIADRGYAQRSPHDGYKPPQVVSTASPPTSRCGLSRSVRELPPFRAACRRYQRAENSRPQGTRKHSYDEMMSSLVK